MQSQEGKRVPEVVFRGRKDGDWHDRTTNDVFAGKRVVVFSLPGAFTPTCSSSHLPRYEELAPVFAEQGVDEVVCVSVNDGFVMEAWGRDQKLQHVNLLADGNGDFTRGLGMLVDKRPLGFGERSWRYSMIVNDGVIDKVFIEPERPGDPFEVSDADTMLAYVAPDASVPREVAIFSKPGCPFCLEAKALLKEHGLGFEEIVLSGAISYQTLRTVTGRATAPQIYIDGEHVGGLTDLKAWLSAS